MEVYFVFVFLGGGRGVEGIELGEDTESIQLAEMRFFSSFLSTALLCRLSYERRQFQGRRDAFGTHDEYRRQVRISRLIFELSIFLDEIRLC